MLGTELVLGHKESGGARLIYVNKACWVFVSGGGTGMQGSE